MAALRVMRAAVAVALLLALGTVVEAAAAPGQRQRATLEHQMVAVVNDVRAARGLRPLSVSPALRAAAVAHSRDMVSGGFFRHESRDGTAFSDRLRRAYPPRPSETWSVGENLFASSAEPTAADAVAAWLASAPHRAILLSRAYEEIGIGIVRATVAGGDFGDRATWVITADFGARSGRAVAGAKP